jgi:hypothetical protein
MRLSWELATLLEAKGLVSLFCELSQTKLDSGVELKRSECSRLQFTAALTEEQMETNFFSRSTRQLSTKVFRLKWIVAV